MKNKKKLTPQQAIQSNLEAGQASIKIKLDNGTIKVFHGTDYMLLLEMSNVKKGTWNKIWNILEKCGNIENQKEEKCF